MMLENIPIYESACLMVHKQVRKSWHRKKRIRKKWRDDQRNWEHKPDPNIYHVRESESAMRMIGFGRREYFIGHPSTIAKLKKEGLA